MRRFRARGLASDRPGESAGVDGLVLIEDHGISDFLPVRDALARACMDAFEARPILYSNGPRRVHSPARRLVARVERRRRGPSAHREGGREVLLPTLSWRQSFRRNRLARVTLRTVRTREEVERLRIEDVFVGDLIYDRVLRKHYLVTLDLRSPEFERAVQEVVHLLVFWRDYIASHDVRSIIVSHEAYLKGVVARAGLARGIPVFRAGHNVVRLVGPVTENLHFSHVRSTISTVRPELIEHHRDGARRHVQALRQAGPSEPAQHATGVPPAQASASTEPPRFAVAVLPHCFWDAPHVLGRHLFPDYWQWLQFIGDESRDLRHHRWYIKRHPDGTEVDDEALSEFVRQFPHFSLIGPEPRPAQLVAMGVRCVITVYGSAGAEYAALGVPTLFAGSRYPGHDFGIGVPSVTREQFRQHLRRLPALRHHVGERSLEDYFASKALIAAASAFRQEIIAHAESESEAQRGRFEVVRDGPHATLQDFIRSGQHLLIPDPLRRPR